MIFISFYGNGQRFDPKFIGDKQESNKDNQILRHIQDRKLGTAFCEPIMESKSIEYKSRFQIVEDSGRGNMVIGICKVVHWIYDSNISIAALTRIWNE